MKVKDFLSPQERNRLKRLMAKMMACKSKKDYSDLKVAVALILKNAFNRFREYS